jgi:hypothetical protein
MDSFPYANSIANLIHQFIGTPQEGLLNVLQINSYPGIFTKNFLLSVIDKKIVRNIKYFVHDCDPSALLELKTKNSLDSLDVKCDFIKNSNLDFIFSSDAEVLILNNFLNSSCQNNLKDILRQLNLENKVKLVIGCESNEADFKIDENFENYKLWDFKGPNLSHYVLLNKCIKNFDLGNIMDQEFKTNNNYEKYLDLVKVLNKISCPQGGDLAKIALNELLQLDGYSANSNLLISKFFRILGNEELAQKHLNKAKLLDSYNLLGIN